jgi:N-dimethylarginine dimethylaminohydrolase
MSYTADPVLLMCPPEFYAIPAPHAEAGHANVFAIRGYEEQQKNTKGFRAESIKQWDRLKLTFNDLGVKTVELDPDRDMPDLVFTADPTLSLVTVQKSMAAKADPRWITVLSHFSNEHRQAEVSANESFLTKNFRGRSIVHAPFHMEGTGDNIYDPFRDVFWSGFVPNAGRLNAASGRSDLRSHKTLETTMGVPVISMAVKKPFFHIDTAMAPLTKGHILCFKDGMQPEAFETLLTRGLDEYGLPRKEYLIEVDRDDAYSYACNVRCIGNTIVMPDCSKDLQNKLLRKGYEVVTTNLSHFIYSGGAVHCLTNNVNEHRVAGGTCEQFSFGRKQLSPVA